MIQISNLEPIPLKEMPDGISPQSRTFRTRCEFEKGKNYLVDAPSGKGKSTLLHILYGIRSDYDGTVQLNGRDIRGYSKDDWAGIRQRQLSIVFQDLRLFPRLTALENILLKANQTATVGEERAVEWAHRLGIGGQLHQTAATLSYGQRQRTAIIRALCQPFDFLLLDEPFSHLDEENTQLASALIREVCEAQSAGFVLVSLGEKYFFQYDETWIL